MANVAKPADSDLKTIFAQLEPLTETVTLVEDGPA
jgi:hypothetical protein